MKFTLVAIVFALSIVGSMQLKSCCDVAAGYYFNHGRQT